MSTRGSTRSLGAQQVMGANPHVQTLRHGVLPFARRHRGMLGRGLLFTCLLVACRLALPLPLGAAVARSQVTAGQPTALPSWVDPVMALAASFVVLALVAGMAEHFQRLAFANFANRSLNDARSEAISRIGDQPGDAPADQAAQVVTDSARVKQGLKGVLNHITVNGLLVIGACVALGITDPGLGLVQLGGTLVVVAVAALGARRVAKMAAEHRAGEALLAGAIHRFLSDERGGPEPDPAGLLQSLDAASGRADTDVTRWEGQTTWVAHVLLTLTAAVVLALGLSAADVGRLSTAELFTVVAYLLVLHGPAVRLARQITRVGSLLISVHHLGLVLTMAANAHAPCRTER